MELPEDSKPNGLEGFLVANKLTVFILLVVGIILIGLGFLGFKLIDFTSSQPKIEILGNEDNKVGDLGVLSSSDKITVEASGELVKPGVYELTIGSRVNDLLILAGGLSANADRDWVAKNVNMAAKLSDGGKIYIPKIGVQGGGFGELGGGVGTKININTASESELDTLPGIGAVTVKKIIDGRPFERPDELLEKKIVKSNVWENIKEKVSVY